MGVILAKTGPKKKPTKLKVLEGTFRKDRALENEIEPEPLSLYPDPPDILNEFGRDEWRIVVPQLQSMGILATVDMAMLTAYCLEWGVYMECEDTLRKQGRMTVAANGTEMVHPLDNVKARSFKAALATAREFGFTPSSRTGIGGPKPKEKDPLEELMKLASGKS